MNFPHFLREEGDVNNSDAPVIMHSFQFYKEDIQLLDIFADTAS